MVKNLPANTGDIKRCGSYLCCQEEPLEEGMATHSRILAWRIPWTEETGVLWSIESHRVAVSDSTEATELAASMHNMQIRCSVTT